MNKLNVFFLKKFCFITTLALTSTAIAVAATKKQATIAKTKPQSAAENSLNDPSLKKMRDKYEAVQTFTAEFTQSQKSATLGRTKESSGRIYIMRPDRFRWETLSPDPSILTSNGIKVWYYSAPFQEGEKGQVSVRKASEVPSKLAVDLMVGGVNMEKTFKYRKAGPNHYQLTPRKAAGDVKLVELFIENQTNLVYKLRLLSNSGNDTVITLKNMELGPKLEASMFDFQIPPNTEVIK